MHVSDHFFLALSVFCSSAGNIAIDKKESDLSVKGSQSCKQTFWVKKKLVRLNYHPSMKAAGEILVSRLIELNYAEQKKEDSTWNGSKTLRL